MQTNSNGSESRSRERGKGVRWWLGDQGTEIFRWG
jgi:hypothetical protein